MADLPTVDKGDDVRPNLATRRTWIQRTSDAIIPAAAFAGFRAYRLVGECVSVCLALGIAVLYILNGLAIRQSTDLTALRPNAERWFAQTFEGVRADLGELSVRWNPSADTIILTATDIAVYDRDDRIVQTLPLMRMTASKSSLLNRVPRLQAVEIVGGEVSWVIKPDGNLIAGIGRPETVGGIGPTYEGEMDTVDGGAMNWLDEFQSLSLLNSRVFVQNQQTGLDATVEMNQFLGRRDGDVAMVEMDGSIVSDEQSGRFQLALQSLDDLETYDINLATEGLRLDSLATDTGRLTALDGIAVPINARIQARYGRTSGLRSASLSVEAGEGRVRLAGEDRSVEKLAFVGALNAGEETMRVATLLIETDRLSLSGAGDIRELGRLYDGDVGTSPKFDLYLDNTSLDLTPIFPDRLTMRSARVNGQIDIDSQRITLDDLQADFGEFGLSLALDVQAGEDGLTTLIAIGGADRPMSPQQLLSLWPTDAAGGARRWIERSVLDGSLNNLAFDIDLDEAFFVSPSLDQGQIDVTFDVVDGVARYISTMTPLTNAKGSGRIHNETFGFVLESGTIDTIDIVGADISIPRLERGGDILISAQGLGPVPALLGLINQPPFRYLDLYGVKPDGFSGTADVTLNIKRPLLEFFDQNRIEYSVDGVFTDTSAPFQFGPYGLTDADVTVTGGKDGLFVNGDVSLGPWRANLSWEERYGQNGEPTRYRISGPMTRKALDGFGFGFREVFGGEVNVDVEATGRGLNIQDSLIDIDLVNADISFGDIWSKSAGEPGQIRATLLRDDDIVTAERVRMTAPGLDLTAMAKLQTDLVLLDAAFETIMIDDMIDGSVTVARDLDNQRLAISAEGKTLNLTSWVQNALTTEEREQSDLPIALDASFDEIILSEGYALGVASLAYRHDGTAIERMSLRGARPDGAFELALNENLDADERAVTIRIPDLSQAASALAGNESLTGGALIIDARLPKAGESGPMLGSARATNFTVRDAPFLAQILSLASLTGIVDTLSGGGLGFDELELDFAMQDRELSIREAKLRGPAIGMTGEGDIDLGDREIDFSGTLVPAYTANSFLGDVPLIGDLLVGKDGEGVFAVTYAVRGPFSGAQIAINPLSALTPGFIRGIFRESRDDLPDSVVEEIESVRPSEETEGG